MAMPWSRAQAIAAEYRSGVRDVAKLTALFDACFRIQREAIEAAGHFIPLVVENVRGACPWVGRSRWNFGSFHLWGDVPALMPWHQGPSHLCGTKFSQSGAAWFDGTPRDKMLDSKGPAAFSSSSQARKAASAAIAKIPLPLSQHIARTWKPMELCA